MILTNRQVLDIYEELEELYIEEGERVTAKYEDLQMHYDKIKFDKFSVEANYDTSVSIVHRIFEGLENNETMSIVTNAFLENKHLNYFAQFMDTNYYNEIEATLKRFELPSDIFKGIKPFEPFDRPIAVGDVIVRVQQDPAIKGESPVKVRGFKISIDGRTISSYGTLKSDDEIWASKEEKLEAYLKALKIKREEKERVSKKGKHYTQISYRNKRGWFVSIKDIMEDYDI